MGRPPSGVHEYLEWQGRLKRFESGDLDLSLFCLQEGTSRSTFYRWKKRLEAGIPEPHDTADAEAVELDGLAPEPTAATFLPISFPWGTGSRWLPACPITVAVISIPNIGDA